MNANTKTSILIIYTGGTIGMIENPATGALENFGLDRFQTIVPELQRMGYRIEALTFSPPIDSSDMEPRNWIDLVRIISLHYDEFDGFVILHGTDTMAYTASALSFMLENLQKPVIITGSQLPIGKLRTDGKENLLTSVEIAAARNDDGTAVIPEVCIYFDGRLMRGNRTTKINSEGFNAFRSYNFPSLAHAGVNIRYSPRLFLPRDPAAPLKPHFLLDDHVMVLTLFPGIREEYVEHFLHFPSLRGIVLKTFGTGNAPQRPWMMDTFKKLNDRGVILVNITQCNEGTVEMQRYETGLQLLQAGVVNGYDSTPEAMITKFMFLLGHHTDRDAIVRGLNTSLCGEITVD